MVEETQEYGRPRRPNPETVSYLNGLPLDESLAAQQVRDYVAHFQKRETTNAHEEPEYPPLLTATHAALSSIQKELASLACEETPSLQVETLLRISCRFSVMAKRAVLCSMATYWPFLCTHRFGSHVAQTALRCVVANCEFNLDEFDDEGKEIAEDSYGSLFSNEDDTSLACLMLQTLEELKPYASELAVHVCGTHVLRSAICILSGVEFVDAFAPNRNDEQSEWDVGGLAAARRGKLKDKKKKKKKKQPSGADGDSHSRQEVTTVKAMSMIPDLQSDKFDEDGKVLMQDLINVICLCDGNNRSDDGKVPPPGELQQRSCHPSAGPLLIQIIRVLSYLDEQSRQSLEKSKSNDIESAADRRLVILPREPQYDQGSNAELIVHKLLCWDLSISHNESDTGESANTQPYAGDVIYGLSGEPRGSVLLETILRCCPDSFHNELCQTGGFYVEETLREYAFHSVSNFVVQAVLNTVRKKTQAAKLIKCLCVMIEDGSILNFKGGDGDSPGNNKRMGIIWRGLEMCVLKSSSQDQEQIIHAMMRGYGSISSGCADNEVDDEVGGRKKRSRAKGLSAQECIPMLLGLKPAGTSVEEDSGYGYRLILDASGARALHHIFNFSERLRLEWVKGFMRVYGQEDLVKIANDGLGSRW